MTYKFTVFENPLCIEKYMEDDEHMRDAECFEDFKEAKQRVLEILDMQVKWALQLNSRNYNKWF